MNKDYDIDSSVRKIKDFPKKGILFYDITSILINPEAFNYCIDRMADLYSGRRLTKIAAVESRGFLFASPFAAKLNLPLLLVRKKNKLPGETISKKYMLEYGEDEVEIHKNDIAPEDTVLVVDDLIATGGTLKATCELIESTGAAVAGIFAVIGLPFLNYMDDLEKYEVKTLINYSTEKTG